ncbi:MAG: hypothetical protein P0S95_07520 [Rhabdochlamydiaceae bacterium]|nr:hypothetical protein [Candidatus Amphrikana amoebophyrae]
MRNRSKLILFFFLFTLLGIVVTLPKYYQAMKKQFEIQAVENLESLLTTSVQLIDFKGLNELNSPEDSSKESYKRILGDLEKVMAANEQKGMFIAFAYILKPSKKSGYLEFIVDGDTSENHFPIGKLTSNYEQRDLLKHLQQTYTPPGYFSTKWGSLLTSYTPIFDADGSYVATMAMSVYQGQIFSNIVVVRQSLIYCSITALILSIVLGWSVAMFLTRKERQD